jgi:hypothetical protein
MTGWDASKGATVTDLRSDKLLEEVRQALKAEGCCAEVEIVKLLGAVPGQRNLEIATIGPNTAPPDARRCIFKPGSDEKFQLRSRRPDAPPASWRRPLTPPLFDA